MAEEKRRYKWTCENEQKLVDFAKFIVGDDESRKSKKKDSNKIDGKQAGQFTNANKYLRHALTNPFT